MKLLLDTHVWLWSLIAPTKLSRRVTRALTRKDNELWLSPISIWELAVLVDKRRVKLDREVGEWVREAMRAAPLTEAPITHAIALETRRVSLAHPDPADRFLVATARVLELTLVTADDRIVDSGSVAVLANS